MARKAHKARKACSAKKNGTVNSNRETNSTMKDDASKREGEFCLKDVLRCNGEIHLYDEILKLAVHADDDPPIIFGWKFVHEFVEAIGAAYNQAANGGAAVPDLPLGLNIPNPFTLTREEFKRALLTYARVGTAGPLGTTCLPCIIGDYGFSVVRLERLSVHPWTQHIIGIGGAGNVLPIANVFIPKPRTDTLQPVLEP
ncbi:Acetylpolyamine aminohydrolase, partial [Phytophthora palmivora]